MRRILKNVMCPEKLNEERNNHCAEKAQMCLSANSSLAVFNPGFGPINTFFQLFVRTNQQMES